MTEIKAKDSKALQTISLLEFAGALGYVEHITKYGVVFEAQRSTLKKHLRISWHSMVLLHNGLKSERVNNVGNEQTLEVGGKVFTLPTYYVRKARGAKLVDKVDLRPINGEQGWDIVTSKEWVRFVNNSYPVTKQILGKTV